MRYDTRLPEMIAFDDRSAFERVISYAIGADKSKECVDRLLDRYGSIATILSENEDEICRVGGVNMSTALLIKLVGYINARRVTDAFEFGVVHDELEIRELLTAVFLGASVETVYALLIDEKGRTVSLEHISDGTVSASDIIPRKVLEFAKKKRACEVILAHNHPKGAPTASNDDIVTTGRLVGVFASVGVRLRSHYIVADGDVTKIDASAYGAL